MTYENDNISIVYEVPKRFDMVSFDKWFNNLPNTRKGGFIKNPEYKKDLTKYTKSEWESKGLNKVVNTMEYLGYSIARTTEEFKEFIEEEGEPDYK
jgi:transposase